MARQTRGDEKRILRAIDHYIRAHGAPPSVRDITEALGFSSSSVTHGRLKRLQREGYLSKEDRKSRSLRLTEKGRMVIGAMEEYEVPVLGLIRAGHPIPTLDGYSPGDETARLRLTQDIVPYEENLYALRVEGDSMQDAFIQDGDTVVLKSEVVPQNGDIVAAWLRDREETTLKRYFRPELRQNAPAVVDDAAYDDIPPEEGTHFVELRPENRAYQVIRVAEENLEVRGVVVAVIRRQIRPTAG